MRARVIWKTIVIPLVSELSCLSISANNGGFIVQTEGLSVGTDSVAEKSWNNRGIVHLERFLFRSRARDTRQLAELAIQWFKTF